MNYPKTVIKKKSLEDKLYLANSIPPESPAVFICNNIQTFVYDAFLLFPNQKRDRAHVDEFSTRNMKALFMIEERTNHLNICLHIKFVAVILN